MTLRQCPWSVGITTGPETSLMKLRLRHWSVGIMTGPETSLSYHSNVSNLTRGFRCCSKVQVTGR